MSISNQNCSGSCKRCCNSFEQLLEACKATKLAIFKEPPERSARWGEVARIIEAALAAAEKE